MKKCEKNKYGTFFYYLCSIILITPERQFLDFFIIFAVSKLQLINEK